MRKAAIITPLYISVAWTLMVSYQFFTQTAVTTVTTCVNMSWPSVGAWLVSEIDLMVLIHSFAWVFLLSSAIPSIILGKERGIVIQFLVCLALTSLAFVSQKVITIDESRVLFHNPFLAIGYLSAPYFFMLGFDIRSRRKQKNKEKTESITAVARMRAKLRLIHLLPNLAGLFLAVLGSIILAGVAWLAWSDMTSWGKDIALVFFGSRTGEAIGLGIGMKVIHYFLIGLALLLSSSIIFLRRWIKAMRTRKMSKGVACAHARSEITMTEFNILPLFYAIVASAIAWFLLWFAYGITEISQFLNSVAFTNLAVVICLIVFVIFGGIEQLKNLLEEVKNKNARTRSRRRNY